MQDISKDTDVFSITCLTVSGEMVSKAALISTANSCTVEAYLSVLPLVLPP